MPNFILTILIPRKVKTQTLNILVIEAREHLHNTYTNPFFVFVMIVLFWILDSAAGFVIPELKEQVFLGSPYVLLSYMQY